MIDTIDADNQTVVVFENEAYNQVLAALVASGVKFEVMNEENYWKLEEFHAQLSYQSSYYDSGC